jgi:tRNA (cytidine/uridine-2'-O-)-methyltransferase
LFHIVLHSPEIASNTGAIIRLCANTGCTLHLIQPISFELDDKKLRRAGLDYHEYAELKTWENIEKCFSTIQPSGYSFFSTKATNLYTEAPYTRNHCLVFGSETQGLPMDFMSFYGEKNYYKLPMQPHSRSLNLANTVSVVAYEGWRQLAFQT